MRITLESQTGALNYLQELISQQCRCVNSLEIVSLENKEVTIGLKKKPKQPQNINGSTKAAELKWKGFG